MRQDAIQLEEQRLKGSGVEERPVFHERHRAFPAVFEQRQHRRILDVAAGVGYVAQRIRDQYSGQMYCNDISPTCLANLRRLDLPVACYSIDQAEASFPFAAQSFDAVVALATIEHVIHVDRFVAEIYRILAPEGCFYVSAPNYAGLLYLMRLVWSGRTFHNPLDGGERYEFYAHVRYFTYRTLLEYIPTFGFVPEAVYLPVPEGSSHYQALYAASRWKAMLFRWGMTAFYRLSPRWSSEPILCFRKTDRALGRPRRVLL